MRRGRCAAAALAPPDRRYRVDVWGFGGDIGAVGHGTVEIGNPAVVGEPDEGSLLDVHFGERGHGVFHGLTVSTPRPSKCLSFRVKTAWSVPRQFRNDISIQQVPAHASSSSANGVLRLVLRSGMVRLVPRGMFSNSHWPSAFRGPSFRSRQTRSGITTNDLRVPMRCGPSSSDRRSISDSRALASDTFQTRGGLTSC